MQFFKLDIYEPGTRNVLSEGELVHQLKHIVNDSRFEDDLSVGILTCEDRNVWAQGYKRLTRGNTLLITIIIIGSITL